MMQDTLSKLEQRLQQSGSLDSGTRAEVLALVASLKSEVAGLSRTHAEQAQSIAGFTAVSAHEATREEPRPELIQLSLQGLSASVRGFEGTHPRLVQVVNSLCSTLANLGI
jgi:hypothetical protein